VLTPGRKFHVSIEKDETGLYVGRCKELPNAFTQARTIAKLKKRMVEVIGLIIEDIEAEHTKNPKKVIEITV
jgi:predicted RNase H-like HicB family nuclease